VVEAVVHVGSTKFVIFQGNVIALVTVKIKTVEMMVVVEAVVHVYFLVYAKMETVLVYLTVQVKNVIKWTGVENHVDVLMD
jgi:hypothetical protein